MRLPLLVLPLLSGCFLLPLPGKLPPLDRDTDLTADTDANVPDTDAPSDDDGGPTGGGDTDVAIDTDPAPDTVCYIGPLRDRAACFPVVPKGAWGADWDWPASSDAQYLSPTHFLDLDAIAADADLAPNFVLAEFAAAYKGQWAVVAPKLVEHLQDVRDALGGPLTVTSGFRNPAYNAGVGGVEFSRHIYGDGVDLDTNATDLNGLADACTGESADYIGYYADHIHCDWRDDALEPAFFGAAGPIVVAHRPEPRFAAELITGDVWTTTASGWDEGEPLREWTAEDADGVVLLTARGDTFTPPPGTARVTVVVGREIRLSDAP